MLRVNRHSQCSGSSRTQDVVSSDTCPQISPWPSTDAKAPTVLYCACCRSVLFTWPHALIRGAFQKLVFCQGHTRSRFLMLHPGRSFTVPQLAPDRCPVDSDVDSCWHARARDVPGTHYNKMKPWRFNHWMYCVFPACLETTGFILCCRGRPLPRLRPLAVCW